VVGALEVERLLLFTTGAQGWEAHAVASTEVEHQFTRTLDPTRHLAAVRWTPTPGTLVLSGAEAEAAAGDLAARGAFVASAQLLGLADRMITMAADYAGQRIQFGVPVGSFQAVKHLLANARVRLEFARPLVYRAAWSLAQRDHDAATHCSMAKSIASDAADQAARAALQVHGAIGYTWECDLHFFMKRAWTLSAEWGNAATQRALVLRSALWHARH
jgi:alkylation response protein AidB-like acyl-CoA dehydrogenase